MPIPPEPEELGVIDIWTGFEGSVLIDGRGDIPIYNITGSAGSYIHVNDPETAHIYTLTPTQIVVKDVNIIINYSQVERLAISGIADSLNDDPLSWTTGDSIDEITVMGTRDELPITVSTGGGDDDIYLQGLVGDGSYVFAGDGNDEVRGSSRGDNLYGGNGDDILTGGGGRDILWGGAGNDVFRYVSAQDSSGATGIDSIYDFERGIDKVDLSGIAAFHWIGAAPFSGTPGELRGTMLGIQGDINGDQVPDLILWLNAPSYGGLGLTTDDFIL